MTWYSVHVATRNPAGGDPQGDLPGLDEFLDELAGHDAVVSGGEDGWGATISVDHDDPHAAADRALFVITKAADSAALPMWPIVRVEAIDHDELDRDLASPLLPDMVSGPEAAELLDVTRQRLHQLRDNPGFPAPLIERPGAVLFARAAVEAFGATRRRTPGRPPTSTSRSATDSAPAVDSADVAFTPAVEMVLVNKRTGKLLSKHVTKNASSTSIVKGEPKRRRARKSS